MSKAHGRGHSAGSRCPLWQAGRPVGVSRALWSTASRIGVSWSRAQHLAKRFRAAKHSAVLNFAKHPLFLDLFVKKC